MAASPNTQITFYFTPHKIITILKIAKFYLVFDLFLFLKEAKILETSEMRW